MPVKYAETQSPENDCGGALAATSAHHYTAQRYRGDCERGKSFEQEGLLVSETISRRSSVHNNVVPFPNQEHLKNIS